MTGSRSLETMEQSCELIHKGAAMVEWSTEIESAFTVLPPGYRSLLTNARERFERDDRVRGMWLHGAIARGALDSGSDLDIDIAVRDDDFDAFASGWTEWSSEITRTVSAVAIPGMPAASTR